MLVSRTREVWLLSISLDPWRPLWASTCRTRGDFNPKPEYRHASAGRMRDRCGAAFQETLHLEIIVHDNGPGVGPEIVDRIFEPLTSSKEEGLGLGLSICASIAETHGGRLWLERSGSDGAEFRLSIPFRR